MREVVPNHCGRYDVPAECFARVERRHLALVEAVGEVPQRLFTGEGFVDPLNEQITVGDLNKERVV